MADRPTDIDDERARRDEDHARQHDPHGAQPARLAEQDEPRAWPSSDRQKQETTVSRVEQREPPRDAQRDQDPRHEINRAEQAAVGLPVMGFYSEQALIEWFHRTYRRTPSAREVGVLMDAMARRDSTPPHEGPEPDPHGWETKAPPGTRR